MPGITGSLIWAFEGETLPIDVTVYNAAGELDEDIASAVLVLERGLSKITKVCEVNNSVVSAVFASEETLVMAGKHRFDFRVTNTAGDGRSVLAGLIWIRKSPVSSPELVV